MLPGIDVWPLQPPGREARIREAPFRRLEPLVDALMEAMGPHLGRPYAFFGHSMGALVAHEAAQRLGRLGAPPPCRLFVSGARAPDRMTGGRLHMLPDAEFAAALGELNGTPQEVLEHQELMDLLMPTLRADFEVCETYEHRERELLACPITAFGGSQDCEVSSEDLRAWARMTRASFESFVLPGDHFFLGPSSDEILRIVEART
jgi:medium-chain acyl-[acyl-carrier-protein] hydrolase